jgi:hypothetical protein
MSQTVFPERVAARPIRALIVRPDDTYEVREIEQDLRTLQGLLGGYLEAISTAHCVFWTNKEGKLKEMPHNDMATYLWWKANPAMEGVDVLQGPVFVTGLEDDYGESTSVPDDVVDLYERMEQIRAEEEGA